MKDIYILAIESSCDETSVSIVKNGKEDISTIINPPSWVVSYYPPSANNDDSYKCTYIPIPNGDTTDAKKM